MCEKPLLKASHIKNNEYNFDKVFEVMKPTFEKSDYVIGNLETISAGNELGYTNHIYSFNTPKQFIRSIKDSGIDMVTTATNHSLDRGIKGLKENLLTLEKYNLENIGTYLNPEERERIFYKEIEGLKIAFLNYTYGTNTHINGEILKEDELFHIGLLKSQDDEINRYELKQNPKSFKGKLSKIFFKIFTLEQWLKFKKVIRKKHNQAYQDNDLSIINEQYLDNIKSDIEKAKSNADFTIVCMHSGGQFHPEPGKFSEYMMKFMDENGVDVVVGNHPHVVQKSDNFINGMVGAYSLGNFSISPSSVYIINEDLPEYSIMLHLYLGKFSKEIEKITFSILKIEESESGNLKVYPITELIKKNKTENERRRVISNTTIIYNRFLNKNIKQLKLKDEFNLR